MPKTTIPRAQRTQQRTLKRLLKSVGEGPTDLSAHAAAASMQTQDSQRISALNRPSRESPANTRASMTPRKVSFEEALAALTLPQRNDVTSAFLAAFSCTGHGGDLGPQHCRMVKTSAAAPAGSFACGYASMPSSPSRLCPSSPVAVAQLPRSRRRSNSDCAAWKRQALHRLSPSVCLSSLADFPEAAEEDNHRESTARKGGKRRSLSRKRLGSQSSGWLEGGRSGDEENWGQFVDVIPPEDGELRHLNTTRSFDQACRLPSPFAFSPYATGRRSPGHVHKHQAEPETRNHFTGTGHRLVSFSRCGNEGMETHPHTHSRPVSGKTHNANGNDTSLDNVTSSFRSMEMSYERCCTEENSQFNGNVDS